MTKLSRSRVDVDETDDEMMPQLKMKMSALSEDAEPHILLHVTHVALGEYVHCLWSSDNTDTFLLFIAINSDIDCRLYVKSGTRSHQRCFDVSKNCSTWSEYLQGCKDLSGIHSSTECERRGKSNALKHLLSKSTKRHTSEDPG